MCFLAFLHQYSHNFSFLSHRLLFSHASSEVRGENTPERKVASTVDRIRNHQVMSPTHSPLSHPGELACKRYERYSYVGHHYFFFFWPIIIYTSVFVQISWNWTLVETVEVGKMPETVFIRIDLSHALVKRVQCISVINDANLDISNPYPVLIWFVFTNRSWQHYSSCS